MDNVIVIPTHITGVKFLENLLKSFNGYDKYPILVVVCDYKQEHQAEFSKIISEFSELPITVENILSNAFELGGLYTAYKKTDYSEFFLLSHSCEILNQDIFDIIFEKHRNRSVAFGLQTGNWNSAIGKWGENRDFILKFLNKDVNCKLTNKGDVKFWQGHIGKYRRVILDKMNLREYLPTNMIESISKSELLFTNTYHSLDQSTIELFPGWNDGNTFEYKFGKKKMKIGNEFIIKWKSHWTPEMVFDDMKKGYCYHKIKSKPKILILSIYKRLRRIKNELLTKHDYLEQKSEKKK